MTTKDQVAAQIEQDPQITTVNLPCGKEVTRHFLNTLLKTHKKVCPLCKKYDIQHQPTERIIN